jgi:hypothetical protein
VLDDAERVATLLREHHVLGGNLSFALAAPLVAADALDIPAPADAACMAEAGQATARSHAKCDRRR